MKKLFSSVFGVVILFSVSLNADAVVTMISGKVLIKKQDSSLWSSARVKAKVVSTDSIQLQTNAKATLRFADGRQMTLTSEGVFRIADLEKKEVSKKNLGKIMKDKTSKNVKKGNVTAVAGVRGADVDSQKNEGISTNIQWKEDK